jgi:hypothetical protein
MLLLLSEWEPVKSNLIDDTEELHRLMGQKQKYDRMVLQAQQNSDDFVPQIAEFEERVKTLQQQHGQNESVKSHLDQELSIKTTAIYQIKDDIARDEQRLTALKPSPASVPSPFNGAQDSKPSSAPTTRVANWAEDGKQECVENLLVLFKTMPLRKSASNKFHIPVSFDANDLNSQTIMDINSVPMLVQAWHEFWYEYAKNPACPSELKDKRFRHPPKLVGVDKDKKLDLAMKFVEAFDLPMHPSHTD